VAGFRVRPLRPRDREVALRYLDRAPRLNLPLVDLVLALGEPPRRGELRSEVLSAWRGGELGGLAGLQPTVLLDAQLPREALEAFFPYLGGVSTSLVKSTEELVAPLWDWLEGRGRRAILDRIENAYAIEPGQLRVEVPPAGARARTGTAVDLAALVEAARESLLEEGRPDPSRRDPTGFRRWVEGRIPRSVVVEAEGRVGFVGYADVRCQRGWLLQGIYTWPALRRKGLAAVGVSELCRRAVAEGAEHVQLAVIDGNAPAEALYERLGYQRFARLRTLLFA
jgi:RimJ/RimL family protein N-acetyltransferase